MVEKFKPQELNVSEKAAIKIKTLLDQEANDKLSLRVFVTGGGCSGFQYGFKLDDEQDAEDTTISNLGVSVVIDSLSMQIIISVHACYSCKQILETFVLT